MNTRTGQRPRSVRLLHQVGACWRQLRFSWFQECRWLHLESLFEAFRDGVQHRHSLQNRQHEGTSCHCDRSFAVHATCKDAVCKGCCRAGGALDDDRGLDLRLWQLGVGETPHEQVSCCRVPHNIRDGFCCFSCPESQIGEPLMAPQKDVTITLALLALGDDVPDIACLRCAIHARQKPTVRAHPKCRWLCQQPLQLSKGPWLITFDGPQFDLVLACCD
mmetsp:Transcript_31615/g.75814  ORF Transcript_31615/g.75814 Transcript_31615/m.75814 type:complete len:219 (+) Transcript_31615:862-1518(+)